MVQSAAAGILVDVEIALPDMTDAETGTADENLTPISTKDRITRITLGL